MTFDPKYDRNLNVLVIGGSGSGKTRFYVKPNLLQANGDYFVTDPKGSLIGETGQFMIDKGYKIKTLNTIEFAKSDGYNPFAYVETDNQLLSTVKCLIKNTKGDDASNGGDQFWEDAPMLLYMAILALLRDYYPESFSLDGLLELMDLAQANEADENAKSQLDRMFTAIEYGVEQVQSTQSAKSTEETRRGRLRTVNESDDLCPPVDGYSAGRGLKWQAVALEHKNGYKPGAIDPKTGKPQGVSTNSPEGYCVKLYNAFKVAAGKTLKSIIISCNVRLLPFAVTQVRDILRSDDMQLNKIGDADQKTIVYAIMSDTDKTYSFLHAMLMWQTLDLLCNKAAIQYAHLGSRLPRLVNFIFDEFANIGHLPDIEQIIAITRSRNIAISVILQSKAQLTSAYDKKANTIIDCCDTTLFLGSKSVETCEEISKMLGKETIETVSDSQNKGKGGGSKSLSNAQRELMTPDEVARLDRDKCLVLIANTWPLKDSKYKLEQHPNYKFIDPGHRGSVYSEIFVVGAKTRREDDELPTYEQIQRSYEKNVQIDEMVRELQEAEDGLNKDKTRLELITEFGVLRRKRDQVELREEEQIRLKELVRLLRAQTTDVAGLQKQSKVLEHSVVEIGPDKLRA